jgi:hypothetical protein
MAANASPSGEAGDGEHRRRRCCGRRESRPEHRRCQSTATVDPNYETKPIIWPACCCDCAEPRPLETGRFEIQADHLSQIRNERHVAPESREIVYRIFGQSCSAHADTNSSLSVTTDKSETPPCSDRRPAARTDVPSVDVARCFPRLTNLPNFALDRLSRYETALWRQVCQSLFALDALDRRKRQERGAPFRHRQPARISGLSED